MGVSLSTFDIGCYRLTQVGVCARFNPNFVSITTSHSYTLTRLQMRWLLCFHFRNQPDDATRRCTIPNIVRFHLFDGNEKINTMVAIFSLGSAVFSKHTTANFKYNFEARITHDTLVPNGVRTCAFICGEWQFELKRYRVIDTLARVLRKRLGAWNCKRSVFHFII